MNHHLEAVVLKQCKTFATSGASNYTVLSPKQ